MKKQNARCVEKTGCPNSEMGCQPNEKQADRFSDPPDPRHFVYCISGGQYARYGSDWRGGSDPGLRHQYSPASAAKEKNEAGLHPFHTEWRCDRSLYLLPCLPAGD